MADPIGEFSLKHTGSAYAKTENGELTNTSNWQGTATGYGSVFGTLSLSQPLAEAGATSGSIGWAGQGFPEDGTTLGAFGEGTWQQHEGQHRWTITMEVEVSNGDRIRTEGEIDLESLTYTGKIFQAD